MSNDLSSNPLLARLVEVARERLDDLKNEAGGYSGYPVIYRRYGRQIEEMEQLINAVEASTADEPSDSRVQRLQDELNITNTLLHSRNALLDAIPECPAHGPQCVPHAIEWVQKRVAKEQRAPFVASEPPSDGLPHYTCPNCEVRDEFSVRHDTVEDQRPGAAGYPVVPVVKCEACGQEVRAELRGDESRIDLPPDDGRPAQPPSEADREDAERWRALISCDRITAMGSAGLENHKGDGYAHLTVNLWTKHPTRETEAYPREWLRKFVDIARGAPTKEVICKTCSQTYRVGARHDCPGLQPKVPAKAPAAEKADAPNERAKAEREVFEIVHRGGLSGETKGDL